MCGAVRKVRTLTHHLQVNLRFRLTNVATSPNNRFQFPLTAGALKRRQSRQSLFGTVEEEEIFNQRGRANMSDPTAVKCLRCQSETEHLGQLPLMTGKSSNAAKFFFGQLAEMGEGHWDVDVFRCAKCGHVEMFDLGAVR